MAELQNSILYGLNRGLMGNRELMVQLHLTVKCDQNCTHCYLHEDSYYKSLVTNELPKEKILNLIDDLVLYAKRQNMTISFHITGGDPILSKNFWEVLEAIKAKYHNIPITIMVNSYHVTETSIREMKKRGVLQYQISLDGLESTHDMIRKKGSFEDGIRALSIIHEQGLVAAGMFTVSRRNYKDFIPLYRYLDELGIVDNLALDRMTAIGNGRNESDELLLPEEYRDFLFSIYKFVAIERPAIVVNIKDNLWKLMLYELGLTLPIPQSKAQICNGCPVGKTICIMPDGEFFLCPRIPISVGKYPEQPIEKIVKNGKQFVVGPLYEKYKGCKTCALFPYCRGCIAASYAASNNLTERDPGCWKKIPQQ